MQVITFRDDALAELSQKGVLLVRGVLVSHFLSPDRVAPLHTSTEIEFKPRTLYKVYTGIAIDGMNNPFMLNLRAVSKLFAFGLEVKRVDIEARNEIVVYVTTMTPFKFIKNEPMFEVIPVVVAALGAESKGFLEIKAEATAGTPGTFHKESLHFKETMPDQPAVVMQHGNAEAEAAKKVADWINSDDPRGRELGTEAPGERVYAGPAVVADTGPKPKSVNEKLARL